MYILSKTSQPEVETHDDPVLFTAPVESFRGSMCCIQYRSAEAVTADGIKWDIYVSNAGLLDGLTGNRRTQISDIRYGTWSAETGLKCGPMCPSEDFRAMEAMGAVP